MSREHESECRGDLIGETVDAIHVRKLKSTASWWIPKSQIGYRKTDRAQKNNGAEAYVTFTLPDWLIEKKECWDLVQ